MSALVPGSPEWLQVISASKTGAILGVSPYQSPYSLWMQMTGRVPRDEGTTTVQARGHYLEAGVLAWWRDQHPEVDEVHMQWSASLGDWGIATLDGLAPTLGGDVLVEVKTARSWDEWGDAGTDVIPAHYYAQVMWQLACVPWAVRAYVAALGPYLDFREYVIERDDDLIEDLIIRCRSFYDSLSLDAPPPLDDHVATLACLRRQHPHIERGTVATITLDEAMEYVAAELALAAAEGRSRAARAVVLAAAGDAHYIDTPDGQRVARRQASGRGVALRRMASTITHHEGAAS